VRSPGTALCSEPWRKFITLCSVKNNQAANPAPRPGYGPLPTARARRRLAHLSTARARILDVLIDQPEPCTVGALAALTHQHPNTIREHLDGLVGGRLAVRTRAPAQGRGRPAWLYSAAPEVGSEPGAREYAGLASALATQIARSSRQPRSDSIEAGRMWGRDLIRDGRAKAAGDGATAAAGTSGTPEIPETPETAGAPVTPAIPAIAARREVVGLLDELGFAPLADARVGVVKLRRCPLLEAAHQCPEVVCGVHLGVVRGALAELGADAGRTEQTALQPFSEPGACRLELLPRTSKHATSRNRL
jgi:predicted ArsR family transcriptional regulator